MSYQIGPAERDDDAAMYEYEGEAPARRHLLRPLVLVLVMAGFAGGLWYAYAHLGSRSPADAPLIRADERATKVRPEQPGGMAIHDLDKRIYDMGRGQPQVEKLLPPPETPLPRPVAAPEPAPPAADNAASPPVPPPSAAQPPATPQAAAPATAENPPAPAALAPAPPAATAAPAVPATVAAPAAAPATTPPAPSLPAAANGGYRLQLAALRSEDAARKQWGKLKQAHKDLLGQLAGTWPRADLGERGVFYRLQAGPIADGAAAERLCGELKRRNVGCVLVRP